ILPNKINTRKFVKFL
ncbi:MAG: hypothetical protein SPLM_01470, partial [Spiroplasma phoeniceum]